MMCTVKGEKMKRCAVRNQRGLQLLGGLVAAERRTRGPLYLRDLKHNKSMKIYISPHASE